MDESMSDTLSWLLERLENEESALKIARECCILLDKLHKDRCDIIHSLLDREWYDYYKDPRMVETMTTSGDCDEVIFYRTLSYSEEVDDFVFLLFERTYLELYKLQKEDELYKLQKEDELVSLQPFKNLIRLHEYGECLCCMYKFVNTTIIDGQYYHVNISLVGCLLFRVCIYSHHPHKLLGVCIFRV